MATFPNPDPNPEPPQRSGQAVGFLWWLIIVVAILVIIWVAVARHPSGGQQRIPNRALAAGQR